ncbi:hypothetical protein CDD80_617 [Ophiocordyceps camponoti-rufipedis]|uniref:Domain of unknown function at the cortex 1 domain-containing protein n=1 Tax=Ophiocordyceps camponoti-rufipedis TaxID=2004952 RepID=A0A2C5ZMJ5_9HYPO|nr:hypothetical protein CDD80_617 [Ophiocordyceps camponoti-rufipedis]
MADQYVLRVTAGSSYDETSHVEVPVNRTEPVRIHSTLADIELSVRIRNYHGLPRASPETSAYFSASPHDANNDQYSIAFRFTPLEPQNCSDQGISGLDLQFGNDFDRPIRDRLPPGFSAALSFVKWWVDPGLDGDPYADQPYLFGPALSSFNHLYVGPGEYDEAKGGLWFEEGGDDQGLAMRAELGVPDTSKTRMKWALREEAKSGWLFRYGQTYGLDFFNPYLDFENLSLRLPGFQLPIIKYWDGQGLRYVLRNKSTGDAYLVILFTLHLKTDVNDDGTLKQRDTSGEQGNETVPGRGPEVATQMEDVD